MNANIPIRVSVSIGAPVLLKTTGAGVREGMPAMAMRLPEDVQKQTIEATGDGFSAQALEAGEFHWRTALSLALASQLAYENRAKVEATLPGWRLRLCDFIDVDHTQCIVAATTNVVLVAFRGTESLGDWLRNLDVLGTTRSYGVVHRGFLSAYQVAERALLQALSASAGLPVLLTGHSLGGALATIAAAELASRFTLAWLYTFGQPAVGTSGFCQWIEQNLPGRLIRFVNDDDIVPRVPPGYRHAGILYHLNTRGGLRRTPAGPRSGRVSIAASMSTMEPQGSDDFMMSEAEFNQLRAQLTLAAGFRGAGNALANEPSVEGLFPGFSDHAISEYVRKILQNVAV